MPLRVPAFPDRLRLRCRVTDIVEAEFALRAPAFHAPRHLWPGVLVEAEPHPVEFVGLKRCGEGLHCAAGVRQAIPEGVGEVGTHRCRGRGGDTVERGEPGYAEARAELQRRVAGKVVVVIPHHLSWRRIVAEVLVDGSNIGEAMDRAGWSKPEGGRR